MKTMIKRRILATIALSAVLVLPACWFGGSLDRERWIEEPLREGTIRVHNGYIEELPGYTAIDQGNPMRELLWGQVGEYRGSSMALNLAHMQSIELNVTPGKYWFSPTYAWPRWTWVQVGDPEVEVTAGETVDVYFVACVSRECLEELCDRQGFHCGYTDVPEDDPLPPIK